jgi:hypothetical protein
MECAICYERFLTPKTKKEFAALLNEHVKQNDDEEIERFLNLIITPRHNNTHTCTTPMCESLFCLNCWGKIKRGGICPFCRMGQ